MDFEEIKEENKELKIDFDNNFNISNIYESFCEKNILVLDNVLSENECNQISEYSEEGRKDIIFSDLSNIIKQRCLKFMPDTIFQEDADLNRPRDHHNNNQYWYFKEINEHWKLYKKNIGSKLSKHFDRICVKNVDCKSIYSILIYLKDSDGELKFDDIIVSPKIGRAVIFKMNLLHEGLENTESTKIFLRSKLMYERDVKIETENDRKALQIYINALKIEKEDRNRYLEMLESAFSLSPHLEKNVLNLF